MTTEPNDADRDLVRRCIGGEEEAWRLLMRETLPAVTRMVRRTLRRFGHPAGETEVEEVSLGVYGLLWEEDCRRLREFRGDCSLSWWVVGLARIEALTRAGEWRRRRMQRVEEAAVPDDASTPDPFEREEIREEVRRGLKTLAEEDRRILRLLYEENKTYRDVAKEMKIPWTTLADRITRLKDRLFAFLEDRIFCL